MDGIQYFIRGQKHVEHLLVSFWSLRRHWLGPIQIVAADPHGDEVARALRDWDPMQGTVITPIEPDKDRRGSNYSTKSLLPSVSVFDRTIFLDADTLVQGDISSLFPRNRNGDSEIVLTQFAGWVTTGNKIAGRIRAWADVAPDEVAFALSTPLAAINTGVMGWSAKGGEFAKRWRTMTLRRVGFIADEISANLIFPQFPHRIEDDHFNASPIYSSPETKATAAIIHGHGMKFFKSDKGWEIFSPALDQARAEMPCLADWLAVRTPLINDLLSARLAVDTNCRAV